MDIAAERLLGHEEANKPTKVMVLSKVPKAWKIQSLVDTGPSGVYETAAPRIFVLGKWTLTAVDEDTATVFKRCK